jgi:hypothetical protein
MSIRSLVVVSGLLALTAAPLTAHADGSDRAADACIQAFVDAYLPKNRQVKVRTVSPVSGPLGAYTKRYTIELSAHLSRSGTELATARCVASATGQVIALDSPTVDQAVTSSRVTRLK